MRHELGLSDDPYLTGFEWTSSGVPQAISIYGEKVWIILVWLGIQETGTDIRRKRDNRFLDVREPRRRKRSVHRDTPVPSGWLVIVPDE